ncbi:uncharacterized protein LOC142981268 [Anticarsia gemmatalis]|uniref:uncharacterized protein LOC142981268 n=1 Tax=Anticarsia gemmatalis TaxID=129554 RepID=UPI003F76B879
MTGCQQLTGTSRRRTHEARALPRDPNAFSACVLAGTPPWDLEAKVLANVYRQTVEARSRGTGPEPEAIARWRQESSRDVLRTWTERLEEPSAGVLTIGAIRPVLVEWTSRGHGVITYCLTQVLSGHGCFGRYLWKVARREPTAECHHCGAVEDTAAHTLSECAAWTEPRARLVAVVGADLSLPAVVRAMVCDASAWRAMITFSQEVMSR